MREITLNDLEDEYLIGALPQEIYGNYIFYGPISIHFPHKIWCPWIEIRARAEAREEDERNKWIYIWNAFKTEENE